MLESLVFLSRLIVVIFVDLHVKMVFLLGLELKVFIWCRDFALSLLILFVFDNEHEVFDKITTSSLYLYF